MQEQIYFKNEKNFFKGEVKKLKKLLKQGNLSDYEYTDVLYQELFLVIEDTHIFFKLGIECTSDLQDFIKNNI